MNSNGTLLGVAGWADQQNRKVLIRLPRKGDSNSYGARPVHQIISMMGQLVVDEESLSLLNLTGAPFNPLPGKILPGSGNFGRNS
jgi:hypothetical protein